MIYNEDDSKRLYDGGGNYVTLHHVDPPEEYDGSPGDCWWKDKHNMWVWGDFRFQNKWIQMVKDGEVMAAATLINVDLETLKEICKK